MGEKLTIQPLPAANLFKHNIKLYNFQNVFLVCGYRHFGCHIAIRLQYFVTPDRNMATRYFETRITYFYVKQAQSCYCVFSPCHTGVLDYGEGLLYR